MLPVRSWIGLAAVAIAAVTLQTALVPGITVRGAKPDLLLALVVYGSLRAGWQDIFAVNCAMGLLKDVHSPAPIGTFGLLFLLTGLALGVLRRHVFSEHLVVQVPVVFVAALVCEGAAALLLSAPAEPVLWGAVYTALITPPLAWLMIGPARWLSLPMNRGRQG